MIRLQCLHGLEENRVFEFDKSAIVMGRGDTCDLRLRDDTCSHQHAKIEVRDHSFLLTDLNSTNGTLLNGKRIKQEEIRYGDRIALGRSLFIFLSEILTQDDSAAVHAEPHIQDTVTSKEAEHRIANLSDLTAELQPRQEADKSSVLEDLRRRNKQMHVLHRLSLGINRTLDLKDLYAFVAECIAKNIEDVERVCIFLREKDCDSLRLEKTVSKNEGKDPPVSRHLLRWVAREKVGILASDAMEDDRFRESETVTMNQLRSFMCVPLINHDNFLGIIYTENCTRAGCFSKDDLDLLTVAGNQTAVAIENATLYEELEVSFYETVRSLCNTLEAKDKYTRGHSARVAFYAVGMAKELGLPSQQVEDLRIAAELHDIGKIAIRENIISKTEKLTEEEFETVKEHPRRGVEILKPIRFLGPILPFIRHHHERYDGTGYPDGLEGDRIPLQARILHLADAFDAMTTQRPYNKPKTPFQSLDDCYREAGKNFDPECVKALQSFLMNKGSKTMVVRPVAMHHA